MSDEKDSQSGPLSEDDADLWQSATQGVQRAPGKTYLKPSDKKSESSKAIDAPKETVLIPKSEPKSRNAQGHDLDRRTEERLRKGQISIEGTLDLHGMNQNQAHEALNAFIQSSYHQGKRCVLVITGKGKAKAQPSDWLDPSPGILKQNVPEWLMRQPIKPIVLKAVPARQKHGGEGALYVYLRRNRNS